MPWRVSNAHATKLNKVAYPSRQTASRPHRPHQSCRGLVGLPALWRTSRACVSLLPAALVHRKRWRSAAYPRRDDSLPGFARNGAAEHEKDTARTPHSAKSTVGQKARGTPGRGDGCRLHRSGLHRAGLRRSTNCAKTHPRSPCRRRRQAADPRRSDRRRAKPIRKPGLFARDKSLCAPWPLVEVLPRGQTRTSRFHCRRSAPAAALAQSWPRTLPTFPSVVHSTLGAAAVNR